MNQRFLLTLLILFPLILAACGGGDDDDIENGDGGQVAEEAAQDCIDPPNPANVRNSYELDFDASFESGVTYRFPSSWVQRGISATEHELRIPHIPPIVFRIVDTQGLRDLGLPESLSAEEANFDRYTEQYYAGRESSGNSSGTAFGQPIANRQFRLPCEGEAHVRFFNNAQGRIMAIDVRSESGTIPPPINVVRDDLWRMLAGQ